METKNFAWPITAISKENYDVITGWAHKIERELGEKQILIFGAGIRGAEIAVILGTLGIKDIVFTDNNADKWGGNIDGHPIISVDDALQSKEKYVFLISVEEGDAICRQLEKSGLKRDKTYFFPKPDFYGNFMEEYKNYTDNGILFLGDCMFEVVAFDDETKISLKEMLREKLGDQTKFLTIHGLSAPGFRHMVIGQMNCGMIPRCIVVMLNFETLTGKQHLLPRSQHTPIIKASCECSPDPTGEMHEYLKTVEERVKNVNAEFFTTSKFSANKEQNNKAGKISNVAAKMFFKMNYLYSLDVEMESIRCLKDIMAMAKEKNIMVIPFVPPVNYEHGRELFGEEVFETKYTANLNKLRQIVADEGYELLDLSHICTKKEFAHVTTPDETTNIIGRKLVTEAIVKELKVKGVIE